MAAAARVVAAAARRRVIQGDCFFLWTAAGCEAVSFICFPARVDGRRLLIFSLDCDLFIASNHGTAHRKLLERSQLIVYFYDEEIVCLPYMIHC